jgi:hypothetical protein
MKKELNSLRKISTNWYEFNDIVHSKTTIKKFILQCLSLELLVVPGCKFIAIQHIKSVPHKINIRNSEFNGHIMEL